MRTMDASRVKSGVRRAAGRLGLEPHLDRAYERVHPLARRSRTDMEHLRMLLAFTLAPDANCIDIGAHSGVVTRDMVRLAPRGRHFAYEALPALAAQLKRELPEVEVRHAAVSNEQGETTFEHVVSNPEFSGMRRRDYPGEQTFEQLTVPMVTLDSDLPEGYAPSFVKVDVEGAERLVFEGGMETLSRHRPIVCFEHGVGAPEHYDTDSGDVFDLVADGMGLRIYDVDGNGPYTRTQFEDVFTEPMWNFVARP